MQRFTLDGEHVDTPVTDLRRPCSIAMAGPDGTSSMRSPNSRTRDVLDGDGRCWGISATTLIAALGHNGVGKDAWVPGITTAPQESVSTLMAISTSGLDRQWTHPQFIRKSSRVLITDRAGRSSAAARQRIDRVDEHRNPDQHEGDQPLGAEGPPRARPAATVRWAMYCSSRRWPSRSAWQPVRSRTMVTGPASSSMTAATGGLGELRSTVHGTDP